MGTPSSLAIGRKGCRNPTIHRGNGSETSLPAAQYSNLASRGLRASAPGEDAKPHPAGNTTLDRCRYNLRGASVRKAEAQPGAIGRRCSHFLQGSDIGCESKDEDRSGDRSCAGSWKNVGTERGPRSRQAPRMVTSRLMSPMERVESWRQNWS